MEIIKYKLSIFIVLSAVVQTYYTAEVENLEHRHRPNRQGEILNPLTNVILNENEIGDVRSNGNHTKDALSRVKRQSYYGYDPYYRRPRPPILPVFLFGGGGWYGGRAFGGRSFGGRGFGGGGFGGRGFGGRGFSGRGIGGRGFGGFGGRGIGGGRGGRG